jgi:hypothetical protein
VSAPRVLRSEARLVRVRDRAARLGLEPNELNLGLGPLGRLL